MNQRPPLTRDPTTPPNLAGVDMLEWYYLIRGLANAMPLDGDAGLCVVPRCMVRYAGEMVERCAPDVPVDVGAVGRKRQRTPEGWRKKP